MTVLCVATDRMKASTLQEVQPQKEVPQGQPELFQSLRGPHTYKIAHNQWVIYIKTRRRRLL